VWKAGRKNNFNLCFGLVKIFNKDLWRLKSKLIKIEWCQYVSLHIKIGWRKVKTSPLGSVRWFWPSTFPRLAVIGKRHSKVVDPQDECNNYYLIAAPCFWLANRNDWSRWLDISRLHLWTGFYFILWTVHTQFATLGKKGLHFCEYAKVVKENYATISLWQSKFGE
jgi:hypothetical protein